MAQFNQRIWRLTEQQYNAGHNISFKKRQYIPLNTQLEDLRHEVVLAAQQGLLSEEISIDAEAQLKKALVQMRKPVSDLWKQILLDHLAATKALLETSPEASDLVSAVVSIIEHVNKSFS
jgi:hypothetical protein